MFSQIRTSLFDISGYLTAPGVLPDRPPDEPEELKDVLADIDKYIMPGVSTCYQI